MKFSKLSAAEFRPIRKKVMRQHGIGLRSKEARGCYTSITKSRQVHCVQFASMKGGGALAVDLGIHFTCVPRFVSPFSPSNPTIILAQECCFKQRLYAPDGSQFFTYGDSPEEAEEIVRSAADRALRSFDTFEATWGDGRRLLDELPPARLRSDVLRFARLLDAPFEQQSQLSQELHIRKLFPNWYSFVLPVCWLLGYLSIHFGFAHLVQEYVDIARHPSQIQIARHYAVDLSTRALQDALPEAPQ